MHKTRARRVEGGEMWGDVEERERETELEFRRRRAHSDLNYGDVNIFYENT